MKLISFAKSSFLLIALNVMPLTGADDIFSPPSNSKKSNSPTFTTKAEFLSETKSGKLPEALMGPFKRVEIGNAVIGILQREYHVETKGLRRDAGSMCGLLLSNLTKYEIENHDQGSVDSYHRNHKMWSGEVPAQVIKAFDQLAIEYAQAVRESMVARKGAEENQAAMLADKQRQIAASEKQAEEDRRMKKVVADAQTASQNAAAEIKTAAAKEAMEAQAKGREQKLQQCLASDEYKLWQAALKVQQGYHMVVKGQKVLEHDDAVKKESGVSDFAARRSAGEEMVAGKSLVEDAFAVYKKLGGKAASPAEVNPGPDPCQAYR